MAKNIIAVKSPNSLLAPNWIERALKDSGYLGVSVVHEGKLVLNHEDKKSSVENIQKVQEHFKDSTVIFCFGENSKTRLPEDRLPFLCTLSKDKGDQAAVFLTGNFEGYAVKGSSHIHEFHCFDDFLSKKLPKIYKGADQNLEEFLKELNDPITQQDISNSWTDRGFITMLLSNGKSFTVYNKGNVFVREYPWGIVSDGLGYEEKAEAPPKEEPKPLSMLEKLMAKKGDTKSSVPPVEAPKVDTSAAAIAAATNNDEYEDYRLPAEAKDWTNKQKIQKWVEEIGYKPEGYKDLKTVVKRKKGTKIGMLHPLANVTKAQDVATPGDQPRVLPGDDKKVDPKTLPDTAPKEAPENFKDTAPKLVSVDNLPIISPKTKLLLRKEFLTDEAVVKVLSDDFQAMALEPKRLKELEDNYQTFWDGLGHAKAPVLSFDAFVKLGMLDIKALAVLAFNNQNDRVAAEVKLASIVKANPSLKIAM